MKKTIETKKLALNKVTLKTLTSKDLDRAVGAWPSTGDTQPCRSQTASCETNC